MRNLASRQPLRRAMVGVAAVVAGSAVLLASLGNTQLGKTVADLIGVAVSIFAGFACLDVWRKKSTFNRGPWIWLATGCFCWSMRMLVQAYWHAGLGQHPSVFADFFDISQSLFFTIALLSFRNVRWSGRVRAAAWLDAVIVTMAMFFLVAVIASRFLDLSPASSLSGALFFADPVDAVFLSALSLMLWAQSLPQRKPSFGLLVLGFAAILVSDAALVLRHGQGVDLGRIWDLGWIAGFLMISLAALYVRPVELAAFQTNEPPPMASLALPYVLVSLDLVWAVITAIIFGPMDRWLTFVAGVIMGLMILRQTLTISQYRAMLDTFARETEVLDNYFATHRLVQTGTGTVELVE